MFDRVWVSTSHFNTRVISQHERCSVKDPVPTLQSGGSFVVTNSINLKSIGCPCWIEIPSRAVDREWVSGGPRVGRFLLTSPRNYSRSMNNPRVL